MSRVVRLTALLFLVSAIPVAAQQFGGSLAIAGNQVIVGETGNSALSGIAYVFEQRAGGWTEIGQISVSDDILDADGFGRSLSADGGWLLAGAPLSSGGAGAAYLFRAVGGGQWTQVMRLATGEMDATFGHAVALDGEVALVSAPGANGGVGAVFVYGRGSDGSWTQTATLDVPAGVQAGFGRSLSFDGDIVLVSSGEAGSGFRAMPTYDVHAFQLDRGSRQWTSAGTFNVEGLPENSGFGASLVVRGDAAYVGAPGVDQRSGAVYVFEWDSSESTWSQSAQLGPLVVAPNSQFGSTIAASQSGLLIGAPGTARGTGTLYAFDRSRDGAWTGANVVTGSVSGGRASFGGSVLVDGDQAVVGALGVDSGAGAALMFARNDAGSWTEQGTVINDPRGRPAITGEEVDCVEGDAAGFECKDVNITAFLPTHEMGGGRGTMLNDIWGWTDPINGHEIAIVGRSDGTSFVDISDPYNPVYIGDLPMTAGSQPNVWRDMKVYQDHVYIVADGAGQHGVQVFDMSQLRDATPGSVFEETFIYDGIASAHNIVLNEETGYAFVVGSSGGGETCGGGLHMLDLTNPSEPLFAGCFAQEGTGRRGTGYSHDAQCVIYRGPDIEHEGKEICFGSNETALNIADVTDKDAPVGLATTTYPKVAYTHQGWLTEDHRYFYMNDEGDEPQGLVEGTRTLVFDVQDLDDPILVNEYIASTPDTDHNLYIVGNTMYQSNYGAGLRVIDITDPVNPVEVGYFDNSPGEGGASWSNYPFFASGVIAVTGTGSGLFLVKDMARRNLIP